MAFPDPVQQRLNRQELIDGIVDRANWSKPDRALVFAKGKCKPGDEDCYLAREAALDDYLDLKKESEIIAERPLAKLKRGDLYRMFKRAIEQNPSTGAMNGYWVCVPGWSSRQPPFDPSASPYGKELLKFFEKNPDVEANLCVFCFPHESQKKPEVPLQHLTPRLVHNEFLRLLRAKRLHEAVPLAWPYVRSSVDKETNVASLVESTTVGSEAIRRWWKKKCFMNPSTAAVRVMPADIAALFRRDHKRVEGSAALRPKNLNLFERWEFDEHKLDAQWAMLLPMLNGRYQEVHVTRLWGLGMVDCSVPLRLASTVSRFMRYRTEDVKRLLYRALFPPAHKKLSLQHAEWKYREGAAFGLEMANFRGSSCKHLACDNDSTHDSSDMRELVQDVLRCLFVQGNVGVPEKDAFAEKLFGLWANAMKLSPSATGNNPDDPAHNPDGRNAAVRHRITWWLAEEIIDVLSRNWNVTPMQSLGGVTPLQAAEDLWRRGRVFQSGFGQFQAPSLFRFLNKNPGTRQPVLGNWRKGHELSPLVVRLGEGVYTSAALNANRDLFHVRNRKVDIYVQEDARFAFVVPHAFPERVIKVALTGKHRDSPHTIEMRQLANRYAKRVVTQDRATVGDAAAAAVAALADRRSRDKAFQHFMGSVLYSYGKFNAGDATYIDMSEEERERLLEEAQAIMRGEGYDADVEEDDVATEGASAAPAQRTTSEQPRIWRPDSPPPDDFDLLGRWR